MSRRVASRLRQLLVETEQVRQRLLEVVLTAGPLVEGSFVTRGRKCGKPSCRCAGGELHYSKFLSRSVGRKPRQIYVPARDELAVASMAESYRRVRKARAELMKLAAHTAGLIDELVEALGEPYPAPSQARSRGTRRSKRSKSSETSR